MQTLFAGGEKGLLFDCSALTGAAGDPVATLSDLSGSGNHLAQAVAAKQPKIVDYGSKRGLSFDGVDDVLQCTSLDLSGSTAVTVLVGVRYYGTALGVLFEHGFYSSGGGLGAYFNNGGQALGAGMGHSNSAYSFQNCPEKTQDQPAVLAITFKPSAAIKQNLRLNGQDVAEINAASSGVVTDAVFGSRPFYLGARTGSAYFAKCELFGMIVIDRELTAQEMADAEAWLACRMPPAMNKTRKHFDVQGTLFRNDLSTHIDSGRGGYVEFLTDATMIEVDSYSSIVGMFPGYPSLADLGVMVNGQLLHTIRHTANGAKKTSLALPPGQKVLRIFNGPQARSAPGAAPGGTWFKGITADAPLKTEPREERLFIYGDSIGTGAWAVDTQENAWTSIVRDQLGYPTIIHAIGSQTLHDDCSTLAATRDFADRIARVAPTKIWLAIGTNDFGLGRWSAAAFGAAYGNLLDAMHELMPWAAIYAQTPLLRTESGVQAYRDAIAAACSTKPWATLVDGTAIMPLSRLPDGLHPDTAGHAMYAEHAAAIMTS